MRAITIFPIITVMFAPSAFPLPTPNIISSHVTYYLFGQSDRDPYLGTWQRTAKDSTGETTITLELKADGSYRKKMDAFLRGQAFHSSEVGTWTADGPVVQCSGDGEAPASNHNLRYYQKIG